jgi:vacuolar-type H+-ATPase subunit D/Vma8
MAETLGSLIDKLSIKNLRYWHLDEDSQARVASDPQKQELMAKMELVDRQRKELLEEIDAFLTSALAGKVRIRDEKVKLYKNLNVTSAKDVKNLGEAVSKLAMSNIKLWHLEDEVRREDLPDIDVVKIKRTIDTNNQERNNFMDKVDEILENFVKQAK